MKCFRVWFDDGTAILVDALTEKDARREAYLKAGMYGQKINRVDQLDA